MSAAAVLATPTPTGTTPTPSATPTPTGTTPTPTPTGTAPAVTWLGENPDAAAVGYVQNKGWENPAQLLDGYRNLEKLVGEQRIALPKDEKDEAAWGKLYDSLGRPKAPAEYKIPVPEGGDPKFAGAAAEQFHKLGLSTKQAQGVATWWNELSAGAAKAQQQAMETRQTQEFEAVKAEWGGAFDERIETGKRAMRTFGIDGELATKLENAMGTKGLLDFAYRIGHALTEHKTDGMDGGAPKAGALTPEQARAEIDRLKGDPEFRQKYTNKNADATARMEQLHKWAYPS